DEAKAYQDELEDEINRQRIEAGKRPFTLDLEKEVKLKERKISKADPESGYYVKGEREKQFAYSAHTSCDDNGFILSTIITPGNIYDSQVAFQLVKQSKRLFPEINCVVADAGYKTPKFVHFLTHLNLRPCLPYSRPKGKKGLLSKNEFLYDEYFDCYICPQDQMLAFSTVTREGYREYKSNPKECVNC
ncbi:TPA: transposase, partial [Enterococcus faecium]|nr:transposase [Enterococcus faecium]HEN1979425.1 transposase [Enterococcus faecium]